MSAFARPLVMNHGKMLAVRCEASSAMNSAVTSAYSPLRDARHSRLNSGMAGRFQTVSESSSQRLSIRTVHTFGHPSSGGPLVNPFQQQPARDSQSFAQTAGEHARINSVHSVAHPRPVDMYGECFGEMVPF